MAPTGSQILVMKGSAREHAFILQVICAFSWGKGLWGLVSRFDNGY